MPQTRTTPTIPTTTDRVAQYSTTTQPPTDRGAIKQRPSTHRPTLGDTNTERERPTPNNPAHPMRSTPATQHPTGATDRPTSKRPTTRRITAAAATLTALLALFVTLLAPTATAATNTATSINTHQTRRPVASRPADPTDALTVGALCLAGIVATAGGVLWYTARTRRTLDSDPS
jgi:hypothetical protein